MIQYPAEQPVSEPRVVLGDPHWMLLDTLTPALRSHGFAVAESASSRAAVIAAVRRHIPDMCLTNSHYGDGDLIDAVDEIRSAAPACKIILLGSEAQPDSLNAALMAGIQGYVDKNRDVSVLLDAMHRTLMGEIVVHASFTRHDVGARVAVAANASASAHARKLAGYLTRREAQCLSMIVSGFSTETITHHLGISRTTARSHIQSMLAKLGVHSRLEAAAFAVQHNLVDVGGVNSRAG